MTSLVASDLDGTLLRSDHSPSPRTIEAVAQLGREGQRFVIATGRPVRWLHEITAALHYEGVVIAGNGSVWWDASRECVVRISTLDSAPAREAVAVLGSIEGVSFAAEYGEDYASDFSWWVAPGFDLDDVHQCDRSELCERPMTKLLARHRDLRPHELAEIVGPALGDQVMATWSADRMGALLEIHAPHVDKAHSLADLADSMGFGADDVVAFGDMPNDNAMLQWSGLGVAVANAADSTKAAANAVTLSNDDDGVAVFLSDHFGLSH